ncbi:ubiquinol oxidase subunit II [Rhodopseudomonas sp. P2A-2r]|uniref:ubiquinol oxidase subunit II n=1 Tax=Rhodopseudomonas sp. P2A-2r TaxID=2991972 RepID=UPI0022345880|nr:ubiquinol oxidase subunit II [Rhodopseudomonas sp. P2A-2r]UZE51715.1 ubiquinol oxidase subunit II [Rhodopseudomonas sp. P2A-2r]
MRISLHGLLSRSSLCRVAILTPLAVLLSGCDAVVLSPAGDVAARQRDLLLISTGLMLLIIIPVLALTVLFAWRYRAANTDARYEPDWDHSTQLELAIWGAPLLIIICLGAITWTGTHLLDPYRPIERIVSGQPVKPGTEPLKVQVVALDWKWLFIYPQLGIATVNELAAPVDRPISFEITSATVMNSFYIPALAGQIYAMPAMQTRLSAVINAPGDYDGFSANYSGAGFSGMKFRFHGQSVADFDAWVAKVRKAGGALGRDGYLALEKPSENEPVRYYASVDADLYHAALNMCVQPGKMCMDEMMHIDAKGGGGVTSINNVLPQAADKYARRASPLTASPTFVAALCTVAEPMGVVSADTSSSRIFPRDPAGITGAGLPKPGLSNASLPRLRPFSIAGLGQPS